ncbi:hypothetical protein V5O48_014832 [Marasmius crinis-equi]|uniref:Uncharacterized protein n=1 Tax=Marasmius crinis-equi TaxID=585013 RepID=A0ABR3EW88_9AGAR
MLQTQKNSARDAMRLYNHNQECMLNLGMRDDDKVFQPLKDDELWCRNVSQARHLGDLSKPDPWYWSIGRPSGGESEEKEMEWKLEMQRVMWFRDRAVLDCWKEEKKVLEAEYVRTVRAHGRMEEIWNAMADEYATLVEPLTATDVQTNAQQWSLKGYQVYARRQAGMYAKLKENVEVQWELWTTVKRPKPQGKAYPGGSVSQAEDEDEEWEEAADDALDGLDEELSDDKD